jgi:hypothetical protein
MEKKAFCLITKTVCNTIVTSFTYAKVLFIYIFTKNYQLLR